MEKISRLTKKSMDRRGLKKVAGAAFVCYEAEKVLKNIFDRDFLKEVGIVSFSLGNLYLHASSSNYIQELKINESKIISELNSILGEPTVAKIRFKQSNRPQEPQ